MALSLAVTNEARIAGAFRQAEAQFSAIDVLVNNADCRS
jgi:NAD(P)-dependent dehydrogenase (short-subunit alcohol dehydrogenase family)